MGLLFNEKRERFKRLAQNQPKLKTGKVFAAEVRRSDVHPSVQKLNARRTQPAVTTKGRCRPAKTLLPHHFRVSP
jgi:hypothetical protein